MEYMRIGPWILGVIGMLIDIQDRCCPDLFVFKLLLSIYIWEVLKNESALQVTHRYEGRRGVLTLKSTDNIVHELNKMCEAS